HRAPRHRTGRRPQGLHRPRPGPGEGAPMNLLAFLLRLSWKGVVLAILAGVISGVSSVGLVAVVHGALGQGIPPPAGLGWAFAVLCVVVLASKTASLTLLIRLSQESVTRLCLNLSRRILAAPLRHLEELGPHRLLATLTNDVFALVQALNVI